MQSILDQVEASSIKDRNNGLETLRSHLRDLQRNANTGSHGLQINPLFGTLFRVITLERGAMSRASGNKTASSAKSAATTRLSNTASTIRLAIETVCPRLRLKTLRPILVHIQANFLESGDTAIFEPLALDYAKSLTTILSFPAHVEHLSSVEWLDLNKLCVNLIRRLATLTDSDTPSTLGRSVLGTPNSQTASSNSFCPNRALRKALIAEFITCLKALTSCSIAPVVKGARSTLSTLTMFLEASESVSSAEVDAVATITRCLRVLRTESISLTSSYIDTSLKVARRLWTARSASMRNELLCLLICLEPYCRYAVLRSYPQTVDSWMPLYDVLVSDMASRPEKDMLQIQDLLLTYTERRSVLCCRTFSLRSSGPRAEQTWSILSLLTTCFSDVTERTDQEESHEQETRPSKRLRTSNRIFDLITLSRRSELSSQVLALQLLCFQAEMCTTSTDDYELMSQFASELCGSEVIAVANWACLLAVCCANHSLAPSKQLILWTKLWQSACRDLSVPSKSRLSSYFVHMVMERRLVPPDTIDAMLEDLTASLHINGPATCNDASCALLEFVVHQQFVERATASSRLPSAVLSWLFDHWIKEIIEDRSNAAEDLLLTPQSILDVVYTCLSIRLPQTFEPVFPQWHRIAMTWQLYEQEKNLVDYLLLQSDKDTPQGQPRKQKETAHYADLQENNATLALLHQLLYRIKDTLLEQWSGERDTHATNAVERQAQRTFTFLRVLGCINDNLLPPNDPCTGELKIAWTSLADAFFIRIGSSHWTQGMKENAIDSIAVETTPRPQQSITIKSPPGWSQDLCRRLYRILDQEQSSQDLQASDDFEMNWDGNGRTAANTRVHSRDERRPMTASWTATAPTMSSVMTYLKMMTCLCPAGEGALLSSAFTEYLGQLDPGALITCGPTFESARRMDLRCHAQQTYDILELVSEVLLQEYTYEHSEAVHSLILGLMNQLIADWTSPAEQKCYGLGLDLYQYFTAVALPSAKLSTKAQMKLSALLVCLWQLDMEYGRTDDLPSVRTTLFTLMRGCNIAAQYHLAHQLPVIFRLYTLPNHNALLEDIKKTLPEDKGFIEGIAIRIFVFAKLGASWHSLFRAAVCYIFDAAGQLDTCIPYAEHVMLELTATLSFTTPQHIFRILASQIIWTWLKDYGLDGLPFRVFGYGSLSELINDNAAEMVAQLIIVGKINQIDTHLPALNVSRDALVHGAFAKITTYAMATDISETMQGRKDPKIESRVIDLINDKTLYSRLVRGSMATIIANFFRCMQVDGGFEKALSSSKTSGDGHMLATLEGIKTLGCSTQTIGPNLEPSFRSRCLLTQLDRICRRSGMELKIALSAVNFTEVARAILDGIHPVLGSAHTSGIFQKIRILITLAPEIACEGYPLEMLLHSLSPHAVDTQCTDDVLGLLRYLYDAGRTYLHTNLDSMLGIMVLTLLRLRKFAVPKADKSMQNSQMQNAVNKTFDFTDWLTEFLTMASQHVQAINQDRYGRLITACRDVSFPPVIHRGTAGGDLLLQILDDAKSPSQLLRASDRQNMLQLLLAYAETPEDRQRDIFGNDVEAARYAPHLWTALQSFVPCERVLGWAGRALGRARNVTHYHDQPGFRNIAPHEEDDGSGKVSPSSQARIAAHLANRLSSASTAEVSLTEICLRAILSREQMAKTPSDFASVLPGHIVAAFVRIEEELIWRAPISQRHPERAHDASTIATGSGQWLLNVVCSVIEANPDDPVLGPLGDLIIGIPKTSEELLPYIIHLGLQRDTQVKAKTKRLMSDVCQQVFASKSSPEVIHAQRLLLQTLEFLLEQPIAKEKVRIDRLQWLSIDIPLAASAALAAGMPTCALYLLEYARPWETKTKTRRASAASSEAVEIERFRKVLLQIFKSVEDPDSFYGMHDAIDLASVMERTEHEQDGRRTLTMHAAELDASYRIRQTDSDVDMSGTINALGLMEYNALSLILQQRSRACGSASANPQNMMNMARQLGQWDITIPPGDATNVGQSLWVMEHLQRATEIGSVQEKIDHAFVQSVKYAMVSSSTSELSDAWSRDLNVLVELDDLAKLKGATDFDNLSRTRLAHLDVSDVQILEQHLHIASYHEGFYGTLRRNNALQEAVGITPAETCVLEAKAVLEAADLAHRNGQLQQSLVLATYLSKLVPLFARSGVSIDAAAQRQTATILWTQGESTPAIRLLQALAARKDLEKQSLPVGRAAVLAQLGKYIAEARLEKPDDIIKTYLKSAIDDLKQTTAPSERGQVYYEFASFCDSQLRNSSSLDDFRRLEARRNKKRTELMQLDKLFKSFTTVTSKEKEEVQRSRARAHRWYLLDEAEYKEAVDIRKTFVQQSLGCYLQAFAACDDHDASILRFFALWQEHTADEQASPIVAKHIEQVPSHKFAILLNQLMSSLQQEDNEFQNILAGLVSRLCIDHPYHTVFHLFASCHSAISEKEGAANSRRLAATQIERSVRGDKQVGQLLVNTWESCEFYHRLAHERTSKGKTSKLTLRSSQAAYQMNKRVSELGVPPATMNIQIRKDRDYSGVPTIVRFRNEMTIASGLSAPKVLTARATDGLQYKQLFKGGNDDLRQDAIMEQVFGEVSKMLRNHKETQRRHLQIRTYKVLPLSSVSGIIEFVPDSIPLNDVLVPAHAKYHPSDITYNKGREEIRHVQDESKEKRILVYKSVAQRYSPVLRHFFFERFEAPEVWFQRRLAYTRSTAAISILSHVLGLGDRHCQNILLDEKKGEVIHIDLGVAFETGRVLPVPETIPFRLTRDIVDGMGITGVEGVFRRCCEFTLEALRMDKDSIMTLLDVLRYDPLYSWTVSPLRLRRMQQTGAQDGVAVGNKGVPTQSTKRDEASEAERALDVVEKKLSKTLSAAATVNELIQQATDERNLALLFAGWAAFS